MFGRSGQMFPRQRAFHDAIYEEEYGSEQDDECCQSRGMSAIFCWFLSVIILIGIAASVVLTVFFILKSKSTISKNGELDVLYDGVHGINFHFPTTTEANSLDFPISSSSSKESSSVHNPSLEDGEDEEEDETDNNDSGTTTSKAVATSTRFPPSRRGPFEMSNEKKSEESKPLKPEFTSSGNQDDFLRPASRETFNSRPHSDEILREESPNRHSASHRNDKSSEYTRPTTLITTTMSTIPSQHVLFTSSPDTPLTSVTPNRRNLQTTRFPTGRTSFSTSTASLHDEEEEDESHTTDGQFHPQDQEDEENHPTVTQPDSVTAPTVLYESKEREVDAKYKEEESQLKKMLLEEIPPHQHDIETSATANQASQEDSNPALSSTFNLPSLPAPSSRDPLARIIKNLAPKWGRNRTIEVTTISSGSHKYDFTISNKEKDRTRIRESGENDSKDKNKSKETSTRSTIVITPESGYPGTSKSSELEVVKLGGKRGNADQPFNTLNTVESPNLSRRQDQETENFDRDNPFLDVLVGSEDHKTLITKQTEDGIVTSAILPPWYANTAGNNNNYSSRTGNTTEERVYEHPIDENSSEAETEKPEEDAGPKSVFGGFLDFFKKLPMSGKNQDTNSKSIVLKRPGGELLAQGSSFVSQSSENPGYQNGPPSFSDLVRKIAPGIQLTTPSLHSAMIPDHGNNGYNYAPSDGSTNIYGYYPDENRDSDKTVEHHGVQSEALSDETMDGVQQDPSHSIELQVGSEASSEIVISDGSQDPYSRYGGGYTGAESHHSTVVTPLNGGGIRRPISEEEDGDMDLDMKGSEIKPVFAHNINQSPFKPSNSTSENSGQYSYESQAYNQSNKSTEMVENSAETAPRPEVHGNLSTDLQSESLEVGETDDGDKVSNLRKGLHEESMGSYEETGLSGSQEDGQKKWSTPDKFNPESSVEKNNNQPPATGSEELKVDPDSGDSNEVLERRPVIQLDEGLYPDSGDTSAGSGLVHSTESKVHQVFPEGYSLTTEKPSDDSAILEPERTSNNNSSGSGFVPPTPVSFHDNKYTFSAPSSDSIFQSKDGWRPLVVNSESSNDESHEGDPARPPLWQIRQPLISRQTNTPSNSLQATHSAVSVPHSHDSFEEDEEEGEEGESEHDDELNKYNWGERDRQLQKTEGRPFVPSQVRFPENPSGEQNYHSYEHQHAQPHPHPLQDHSKLKKPAVQPQYQGLPHPPQQQEQSHPPQQQVPSNPQQQLPSNPQQQLPSNARQQPPQRPQQQPIPPRQQLIRQQFQYQNSQNIDRSKYMMRPALPPIVMRRPPIQGIPYPPNRIGTRPQLIPQVQQQTQFANNAHPTEFPHPVNRRLFKNLGPRPRGNVNWPTDETRKIDTAEKRTG